jgi:hypothetical protein
MNIIYIYIKRLVCYSMRMNSLSGITPCSIYLYDQSSHHRRRVHPKSFVRRTTTATLLMIAVTLPFSSMALPLPAERFTLTPLFREYPWHSDTFIFNRWLHEACEFKGLRPFAEFLARLDEQVPLASSTEFSDAETRTLLGLPNNYSLHRSQVAPNCRAMSKCWTTMLRFQTLDVLLATRTGTSDMPCEVRPAPTGAKQSEVGVSVLC